MKKADFFLAAGLLLFCALTAWLPLHLNQSRSDELRIEVDGELYGTYLLSEEQTISVDSEYGHNQVTIADGKAYMSEADCPDGYCMQQHRSSGGISNGGQSLICLPNRVVVSVDDPDTKENNDAGEGNGENQKNTDGSGTDVQKQPDAVSGAPVT